MYTDHYTLYCYNDSPRGCLNILCDLSASLLCGFSWIMCQICLETILLRRIFILAIDLNRYAVRTSESTAVASVL
jgi:hypothetical protein